MKKLLKNFISLKEFLSMLSACSVIAVLLTGINVLSMGQPFVDTIWQQFLSSNVIGFSIFTIIKLSGITQRKTTAGTWFYTILLFIFGGWLGMFILFVLFKYVLLYPLTFDWIRKSVFSMSFFAVFFGIVFGSYFSLKEKLEKTAAELAEKEIIEQNLKQLKTIAELEALRAKVNPHFLFNTLNSIASLIPQNPGKAEEMVVKLSSLLRYTLDVTSKSMVRLDDEITIIREYLEIEKVRLGERLDYSIEMDENISSITVPGLLLQPLVENSVKHGIASQIKGGKITVKCLSENNKTCVIEIIDTGRFKEGAQGEGFGLSGVRERLALHYPENHDFTLSCDGETRIVIRLPIEEFGGAQS